MKRFYKEARVLPAEGGFGVALDGKPMRTPMRAPLVVPSEALAEAIAAEWNAQGETIARETMRLTRLACTALDRVPSQRDAVLDELAGYGATDLLCYRADAPAALVARQAEAWDPLLAWAAETYGATLSVTQGIRPISQSTEAIGRLRASAAALDAFRLTALHLATSASGSLVLGLALIAGRLDAGAVWAASQIDETHQIETWGEDEEFEQRRNSLCSDLEAAMEAVRRLG